jgi:hypothetical protein
MADEIEQAVRRNSGLIAEELLAVTPTEDDG